MRGTTASLTKKFNLKFVLSNFTCIKVPLNAGNGHKKFNDFIGLPADKRNLFKYTLQAFFSVQISNTFLKK